MRTATKESGVGAQVAVAPLAQTSKRLNLILPGSAYEEVGRLSNETRRTVSELVRFGLALVRIAVEERRAGNRLVVTRSNGETIKEVLIPF